MDEVEVLAVLASFQEVLEPGQISSTSGISLHLDHTKRATLPLKPDADWPKPEKQLEQDLLVVTSNARIAKGLKALAFQPNLVISSEYGAAFLANYQLLLHDYPAVPGHLALSCADRISDAGYNGAWGENAAYGYQDAPSVFNALISAGPGEGHYDNIFNPSWDCCGMGCARDPKTGLLFWTQDFGIMPTSGPRPLISGISPTHGEVGSGVRIAGSNFYNVVNVVFIGDGTGNKPAKYTVESEKMIIATVPEGATPGGIAVSTKGGYAISANFVVEAGIPQPPPPGGTVFEQWKLQVWPLLRVSKQWMGFAGNTHNSQDVALINKLLENPKATGSAKAAFAQAIVADIRLSAAH